MNKYSFNNFDFDTFFKSAEGFLQKEFSSDFLYNEYLSRSNIKTTDSGYTLQVTVPGCSSEDVDVFVEKDVLRVKSEKQRFERKYSIPKDVDNDRIAASVRHGLLDVTLPRVIEEKKSRKLDIK